MATAVHQVHVAGIVHFDIKPDNFLIFSAGISGGNQVEVDSNTSRNSNSDMIIKLTDFGLSRIAYRNTNETDGDRNRDEILVRGRMGTV